MAAVTQGRRIPDGSKWYGDTLQPGDYGRVMSDGAWIWKAMTPNGMIGDLSRHDVVEHEDGTITVSPSILVEGEFHWHGYLERGVWRDA